MKSIATITKELSKSLDEISCILDDVLIIMRGEPVEKSNEAPKPLPRSFVEDMMIQVEKACRIETMAHEIKDIFNNDTAVNGTPESVNARY